MGLPALNGRGALRWRPNGQLLPIAIWPFYLIWRGTSVVLGLLWRAPELLVPALHRRREMRRCHRELDRAISVARRHQKSLDDDAADAPFAAPPLAPMRTRPPTIVLSFPSTARNAE